MKKTLALILALMIVLCLAACGDTGKEPEKYPAGDPGTNQDPTPEKETYTVVFRIPKTGKEEWGDYDTFTLENVEAGTVLESPEKIGLKIPDFYWGYEVVSVDYYYLPEGLPWEMSSPINSDMEIQVSGMMSGAAEPEPGPVDTAIHVTGLDVPNCKYFDNAYRYQLLMKPGDIFQLQVVLTPDNATDKSIRYDVEKDNGVISVSSTGLVKALKYGSNFINPVALDGGWNVGIRTEVFGYEMTVSIPVTVTQKSAYTERDTVPLAVESIWHGYTTEKFDSFPDRVTMEVVSGSKDVLKFDSYYRLTVAKNPDHDETIKVRFIREDAYGIDRSNIVEIPVYHWIVIN